MRNSNFSRLSLDFLHQDQVLFWLEGRFLLMVAGKKRKQLLLKADSGIADGLIANEEAAVKTISAFCHENEIRFQNLFKIHQAIIFIPTNSSPVEQSLIKRVFSQVGFRQIELRLYATAFRAFLAKQAFERGIFVYIGQEISEIGVFSDRDQQSFSIYFSIKEAMEIVTHFFREKHLFAISPVVANQVYEEIGKHGEKFSLTIRGRESRSREIATHSFSFKEIEPLHQVLKRKVEKELLSVIGDKLFREIQPDKWVILGDNFWFNNLKSQADKALQLQTAFDLMQGVEWL